MNRLSQAAYQRAVTYLQHQARPIDRARFAYYFTGGSAAALLNELATFQNTDGGFGHALEPDIRLPDSSAIATTVAFQTLREVNAPASHPLVVSGCRYLLDTYDAPQLNWAIVPPNIGNAPHAQWWTYGSDLGKSLANPRAEIAGYLNDYPEHFPADMREQVTNAVSAHFAAQPDKIEMSDLLCFIRFWETASLPAAQKEAMSARLVHYADQVVQRFADGKSYGLSPLELAPTPDSPFAARYAAEIEHRLDVMVASQQDNGSWQPNWWWDIHQESWPQAKHDWSGFITVHNLHVLHAYGRIDG